MRILVTGANGYIGQGVVCQLLNDGADVVAADVSADNIDKRAKATVADIFELENPFEYFNRPDIVLHLAWRNGFVHNELSHINDLSKHYLFLKKLMESGIRKAAVMGSMHEIGFFEGSISADTPANPQSLYGISKNALRQSLELLAKQTGVEFQWIRGFYIVGNSDYGCSVFSKITAAEKRGEKTFPFTSGQNQWDFTDYDDFCRQVAAIVEQEKYLGIINACSGRPQKLAERVERFIRENNYSIRPEYGKFPDRPYDSKAVWGDSKIIEKIMEEKGDNQNF